ncbi:MAG: hypothetical protein ACRC2O_12980, partial [Chitinophagaceae bacterium]
NVSFLFSQSQSLQPKQKNTRFQSYNAIALITGEKGAGFGIQSVNGVQWKSFFIGAGVGFDFYGISTTPVFLDIRKTFGQGKNKFFAYGDAGYNIAWPGSSSANFNSSFQEMDGGFYSDLGIGYLVGFGKRDALILSAGYTFKSLSDNLVAYPLCIPGVVCEPVTERYEYRFNRITIKAGWRF